MIVIANRNHLEDVKNLVAALQESVDLIHYSPEQAWCYYVKGAPEQNTPQNKIIFMRIIELLTKEVGALPKHRYNEFAAFLAASGILKAAIPTDYARDGSL